MIPARFQRWVFPAALLVLGVVTGVWLLASVGASSAC